MSGLVVAGVEVAVDGLEIVNRNDAPWARLDPRDYRMRRSAWVRQIIVHTTKGIHPQHVKPGAGPRGAAALVAEFWRRDVKQSATHLVVGRAGEVACLADLVAVCAYHATHSNDLSIGIEMYQEADGGLYEATLDATVRLVRALCDLLLIPYQCPSDAYRNAPLARMSGDDGGRDCVGVFGHRNNTHDRGRGDPGDEIFRRLRADGCEPLDYSTAEDLKVCRRRQQRLVDWGVRGITVDGLCGQQTVAAIQRLGFANGREL